jgi:hypothetical protein
MHFQISKLANEYCTECGGSGMVEKEVCECVQENLKAKQREFHLV